MTNLMRLQNQFQNYLLKDHIAIRKSIISTEKVAANQRLSIYYDAYRYRLLETLMNNFPILSSYLDKEEFQKLGENYISHFTSPYRSIRWYGDSFAEFIKVHGKPHWAELAEFEWKTGLAFDAADEQTLTIEQISAIPPTQWADMRFKPHASLQRMDTAWNCVKIWEAVSNNQQPEEPTPNPHLVSLALWRSDYLNRFYTLAEDEGWALDALIQEATFGELCEGLCQWFTEEEVGMRAASLLKGWIELGLLKSVICP